MYVTEKCSSKCVWGYCQPSGKLVKGDQRVLSILWQICYKVSEGIGKPKTKSLEGIGNWQHGCQRTANTVIHSDFLSEGTDCPLEQSREGIG
jgi:hypothetical protein